MKRLNIAVLVTLLAASAGLSAVAAPATQASLGNSGHNVIAQATPAATTTTTTTTSAPPMQFGAPPSGSVPILFNDHHVYSKPDVLKQGRVLAALIRGGTILVPLRSMFEQMGATVNFDPGTRTVDVTKPGADVKVTLGKAEVTINGETRPLDVPPMMYQGQILVPVRVISEGMGAYVQWVPDQHVVVVRYAPPTPPPPAATTAPATPVPTAAPTPTPAPAVYQDHFIAGDYIISPQTYNEFSPGNRQKTGSYALRGAFEFNLFNLPWMIAGDMRTYAFQHNCPDLAPAPAGSQCTVTAIGGTGTSYVPAFIGRDRDIDARFGLRVAEPRIYIGVGYLWRSSDYGYPRQTGIGFGVEKLPDLDKPFSLYGSAYYYPSIKGNCGIATCPTGPYDLAYRMLKYQIGGALNFGHPGGVFLDFGYLGDRLNNKTNAPADVTHTGPYIGLGIHF